MKYGLTKIVPLVLVLQLAGCISDHDISFTAKNLGLSLNAKGAWPTMWMLAEQNKYGKYPRNGEIHLMEHLNYDSSVFQTVHSYYTLELKQKENPPYDASSVINTKQFNTFGLRWYPNKLIFCLNGKEAFTYPKIKGVGPSMAL